MGRYRDYNYGGFAPYVPVAQRRANAKREMEKLRKKGLDVQPVEIEGRTIAHSFWGKGWCQHLEGFGDYSNRLPRGRTYARNGSVCHLGIAKGKVEAMVSGSELYSITVTITSLPEGKWNDLKKCCTGRIGSLIELLQGKLSDGVMSAVTDAKQGLFPQRQEISYKCDCPDGAGMCKHIAAVMYGIGARLDTKPELLFLLRGVDHAELISGDLAAEAITGKRSSRSRRRVLASDALEDVFGVELDNTDDAVQPPKPLLPSLKRATKRENGAGPKKAAAKKSAKQTKRPAARKQRAVPFKPTAAAVRKLRRQLGLSLAAFARQIGVSAPTIANWEKSKGALRPQPRSLKALQQVHERVSATV